MKLRTKKKTPKTKRERPGLEVCSKLWKAGLPQCPVAAEPEAVEAFLLRACSIARPTQPPGTVHAVDGVLCYQCLFIQIEKRYYPSFLEFRRYVQPPVCDHTFRCVCINKHPILDTCVLAHKMFHIFNSPYQRWTG